MTLALAAVYALFSLASDGYYQHDEIAHFIGMRQFWHDPSSALGNWAKPGYKVLYAPFALLGRHAIVVVNSLVAAGCAFAATKAAARMGARQPLVAFALLALQPLWLGLAFRCYAELPTALLLILAIWAHAASRHGWAALALSYAVTIRQELAPVALLYGVWLASGRRWTALPLLAVFPLLVNAWGWAATGEPLYLLREAVGTGAAIADAYPRQGLWHYPSTVLVVFGGLAVAWLAAYAAQIGRTVEDADGAAEAESARWHPFVVVPLVLYTAAHVAFQIQSVPIGPATGGNLRYLTVVAPLVAVLGALAAGRWRRGDRTRLAVAMGLVGIATAAFLSHADNGIALLPERSGLPLLTVALAAATVLVDVRMRTRLALIAAVALVGAGFVVRPKTQTLEEATAAEAARWLQSADGGLDARPLLISHPVVNLTNDSAPGDYAMGSKAVTGATIRAAAPGTRIVWDSHYSYRPRLRADDIDYETLLADTAAFRLVRDPFVSADQSFGIFVFDKLR